MFARINLSLKVFDQVPDNGYHCKPWEINNIGAWVIRDETGKIIGKLDPYHHCIRCSGYINGEPIEERVDNFGILSERRGFEYSCRRCGYCLHFSGIMS